MTENEWLSSTPPYRLQEFLWHAKIDVRKFRLCAIAHCKPVLHLLQSEFYRDALDVALHYAQGQAPFVDLARVSHLMFNVPAGGIDCSDDWRDTAESRMHQAMGLARWAICLAALPSRAEGIIQGARHVLRAIELTGGNVQQAALFLCDSLRDIIGNPFRRPVVDPAWLRYGDGRVQKLAAKIDDLGCYEELPLLADALREAGCTDAAILEHCRGPGPHVPGCSQNYS